MKSIAIARNTFREAVRDKVFLLVGVFGLLLVLSSVAMSPLTVGAQNKIVADIGLAALSVFSLLVILLVGSGMLHKEMDKRTIMTMLSKPISRLEYLVGKYLGLVGTLFVMMSVMFLLFLLACLVTGTPIRIGYLLSFGMSAVEMMVVTAVVVFFSTFSTPVLTSLFTLGVFIAGHTVQDLESFATVTGSHAVAKVMHVVKWVLPNLDLFNLRNAVVHGLPIQPSHVMWAATYGLMYALLLISLSDLSFRRREFK